MPFAQPYPRSFMDSIAKIRAVVPVPATRAHASGTRNFRDEYARALGMEVAKRRQEEEMNLLLTLLYAQLVLMTTTAACCLTTALLEASRTGSRQRLTLTDPTPAT